MKKYIKPAIKTVAIAMENIMQESGPKADDAIFGWDDYYDYHENNAIQNKSVWDE